MRVRVFLAQAVLGACVLAAGARGAAAATPEEIFDRGNAAYEQGRYEEAVEAYQTVARYGVRDARVEYNLGNALFKLGRIGEAILHYERAHRLAPADADVESNLALAVSRRFDKVDPPETAALLRWLRVAQDRTGPDVQAAALLVLCWVACGIAVAGWARPAGWTAAKGWGLAVVLALLTGVAASWYGTLARLEGTSRAVVLQKVVQVLAGPGGNNASLFTVHEGLTVEVRSERPGWVQVSLPNGLNGWIPRDAIEVI